MKLLEITGTNSESFSIGLGEKKIELKTIDGVLYFRNFTGGWNRVSSEAIRDSVVPRAWTEQSEFVAGEIISYSDSLWYVQNRFSSTSSFLEDSKNLFKIKDVGLFTSHDISTSRTFIETAESSDFLYIFGTVLDVLPSYINLPDATTIDVGRTFLIQNKSSNEIIIRNHIEEALGTIPANAQGSVTLIGGSIAAGVWSYYFFSNASDDSGGPSEIKVSIESSSTWSPGQVVTLNSSGAWIPALSTGGTFPVIGVIKSRASKTMIIHLLGEALLEGITNLIPGSDYYLSESSAGAYTTTPGKYGYAIFKAVTTSRMVMLSSNDTVQYFSRATVTLNDSEFIEINSVPYNLSFSDNDFTFELHVEDDPTICLQGFYKRGTPPDISVTTTSPKIIDFEAPGFLCLLVDGNSFNIKNKLGSTKKLVFYRYI